MFKRILPPMAAIVAALLSACTSTPPLGAYIQTTASGTASAGAAIANGTVTISTPNSDGSPGAALTSTLQTDAAGQFQLTSAQMGAPALLCVTGGSTTDIASGIPAQLPPGTGLCAFVPDEATLQNPIAISPWTHLAYVLAQNRAKAQGMWVSDKLPGAIKDINAYLSCAGSRDVVGAIPLDPTVASHGDLTAPLLSGILLGGLSEQAALISDNLGYSAGLRINGLSLASAMADDLRADGIFDGKGAGGAISVDRFPLAPDTFRGGALGFAQGVRHFLEDPRNATGMRAADLTDLATCLANASGNLFSGTASPVDFQGPTIAFDPQVKAVSGTVHVCASVSDASGVQSAVFTPAIAGTTFTDGRLCADIDTTASPDGTLTVTATARDTVGNTSTGSVSLHVDNGGPVITLVAPTAGSALSGVARLTITVKDDDGVAGVQALAPADATITPDATPGSYIVEVDTTQQPDSTSFSLELQATDTNGVVSQQTFTFGTDNFDAGQLQFCAFADSPIVSAAVTACWLEASGSCTAYVLPQAVTTDSNGCASLPLPDSRAGWLRVTTSGGTYRSATASDSKGSPAVVILPANRGVHASFTYTPARPAAALTNRSLNYATTLADAWADNRLTAGKTAAPLDATLQHANDLLAAHLGRDLAQALDIRGTYSRDVVANTTHATLTSEESTRLALVGIGLAECAAEWAIANGSAADSQPSYSLVSVLTTLDTSNSYFDGLDASNTVITVAGHALDQNTLRYTLANCAALWMGNGRAGLTPSQYAQPNGFFSVLASDDSRELFGDAAASTIQAFDQTPPVISQFAIVNTLHQPQSLDPVPNAPPVLLRVWATDMSGFKAADGSPFLPTLTLDPGPSSALSLYQAPQLTQTDLDALYLVDLSKLSDGAQKATVTLRDAASNKNTVSQSITLRIDKTPPTFTAFSAPSATRVPQIHLTWAVSEQLAKLQLLSDGTAAGALLDPASTSLDYALPACNQTYKLSLSATDLAGNVGTPTSPATVVCDNTPPTLTFSAPGKAQSATGLGVSWTTNKALSLVEIFDGDVDLTPPLKVIHSPSATTTSATVDASPCNRTITLNLRGTDLFGNTTVAAPAAVACNGSAAAFTAFTLDKRYVNGAGVFTANWTASDPLNKLEVLANGSVLATQNVAGSTSGSLLATLTSCNADFTITLRGTDVFGNVGSTTAAQALTLTCDTVAPTVAVSTPTLGKTNSQLVPITWTANEKVQGFDVYLDSSPTAKQSAAASATGATVDIGSCNRTAQIVVKATDLAGNLGASLPLAVVCDNTPPQVSVSTPSPYTSSTTVTASWTTNKPLAKVELFDGIIGNGGQPLGTVTTNITSLPVTLVSCNKLATLSLRATDLFGNVNTATTTVTCDNIYPSIKAFAATRYVKTAADLAATWTASEQLSNVELLVAGQVVNHIAYPPGSSGSITGNLGGCNNDYKVDLRVTDLALNATPTTLAQQQTVTCDSIAPTLTLSGPARTNSTSVPITWTANEAVQGFDVYLDSSSTPKQSAAASATGATIDIGSCNRTALLKVKASDLAGNPGESPTLSVDCSDTKPTLQLSVASPLVSDVDFTVTALWTSSKALQKVELWDAGVDSGQLLKTITDGSTSSSVSLKNCNRTAALWMRGTDLYGNTNTTSASVTCDNTPPSLTAFNPAARYVPDLNTPAGATWASNEPLSKLEMFFDANTTPAATLSGPFSSGSITAKLTVCDVNVNVKLRLTDLAGNQFTTPSGLFVACDSIPPVISLTAPPTKVGIPSATLSGSLADSASGLKTLAFTVAGYHSSTTTYVNQGSANFVQAVTIACNIDTPPAIVLTATDQMGHSSSTSATVFCDSVPPSVLIADAPLASKKVPTYMPASTVTVNLGAGGTSMTYSGGTPVTLDAAFWATVPTIEAYLQRLDFLPAQGITTDSNGLAEIKVVFDDCKDGKSVCTDASSLGAQYRYYQNESPITNWIPLAGTSFTSDSVAPRTYYLPISYQALSQSASIGRTPATTVHRVDFMAKDEVGNQTTTTVRFRLKQFAPPLWLSNCSIDNATFNTYNLANDNFDALFSTVATQRAWYGTAWFLTGAPAGSLMPIVQPKLANAAYGLSTTLDKQIDQVYVDSAPSVQTYAPETIPSTMQYAGGSLWTVSQYAVNYYGYLMSGIDVPYVDASNLGTATGYAFHWWWANLPADGLDTMWHSYMPGAPEFTWQWNVRTETDGMTLPGSLSGSVRTSLAVSLGASTIPPDATGAYPLPYNGSPVTFAYYVNDPSITNAIACTGCSQSGSAYTPHAPAHSNPVTGKTYYVMESAPFRQYHSGGLGHISYSQCCSDWQDCDGSGYCQCSANCGDADYYLYGVADYHLLQLVQQMTLTTPAPPSAVAVTYPLGSITLTVPVRATDAACGSPRTRTLAE